MRFQFGSIICTCLLSLCIFTGAAEQDPPNLLIGYNEHRTNLPGGRYANIITNRAMLVQADGTQRRPLVAELASEVGSWTQFAGWSPDGRMAVVGRGWESVENADWEEKHKTFRFSAEGWLYDSYLVDVATGIAEGTLHYHPKPSPDGKWIVYGSKRNGVRNLFLMRLFDRKEQALTDLPTGHAAMHAYWQPLISKSGEASIQTTTGETPLNNIQTAISGFALCLSDGVVKPSGNDLHPRTGLGLSADGKSLFVVAIDGRRYSRQGATTQELGAWLKKFGADDGINMDGGGSTTLVWWNPQASDDAKSQLINSPVGSGVKFESEIADRQYVPTERANGNNFGVYYQQVP